jgi:hypothetical protein
MLLFSYHCINLHTDTRAYMYMQEISPKTGIQLIELLDNESIRVDPSVDARAVILANRGEIHALTY